MQKRFAGGLIAAICLSACGTDNADSGNDVDATASAPEAAGVVNIYTSRHYDTDLALYDDFTAQTGIKVNRIEAGADELIARIRSEGEFSPADLLITVDAGRLWRAEQAEIFEPVNSDVLNSRIPANLRHPDGLWFGLSTRARVIIYNKESGLPDNLRNYEDLASPDFADSVCIRSSSNIYNISLMASLISHMGVEAAEEWGRGVVSNFAREPQSNDVGHIRSVSSGECALAVVNSYYIARLVASTNESDKAMIDRVGVLFPNQDTTGTHVNISGAGLVKTAPNRENAIRFLEYLTSESAQNYFANGNFEYPVVEGVASSEALRSFGEFQPDRLNASQLGVHQAEAVRTFDRVGWK